MARRRPVNRLKKRGLAAREFSGKAWLRHHEHELKDSLLRIVQRPAASLLTWLVIGIALSLPALLYVVDKNLRQLAGEWQQGARISLYLTAETDTDAGRGLAQRLADREEIADTEFISRDQALTEFASWYNLESSLDELERNPLPATLVVLPEGSTRADIEALSALLENLPEVESLQMDIEWVQRLEQLSTMLRSALYGLAILFGLTVVLVVGNTMRMATLARRDEIQVTKLVGATDSFVRRPFLYMGFWYGLLGGVAAVIMTLVFVGVLAGPAREFLASYNSGFRFGGLSPADATLLILSAVGLSIVSTWLTVTRRLQKIEPDPV